MTAVHSASLAGNQNGRKFDVDDYRREFEEMAAAGVRAIDFINRSNPSQKWFNRNIMHLVTNSVCSMCGSHFNPSRTGTLTKCHPMCGTNMARGTRA